MRSIKERCIRINLWRGIQRTHHGLAGCLGQQSLRASIKQEGEKGKRLDLVGRVGLVGGLVGLSGSLVDLLRGLVGSLVGSLGDGSLGLVDLLGCLLGCGLLRDLVGDLGNLVLCGLGSAKNMTVDLVNDRLDLVDNVGAKLVGLLLDGSVLGKDDGLHVLGDLTETLDELVGELLALLGKSVELGNESVGDVGRLVDSGVGSGTELAVDSGSLVDNFLDDRRGLLEERENTLEVSTYNREPVIVGARVNLGLKPCIIPCWRARTWLQGVLTWS